jgi:hypothetical protein
MKTIDHRHSATPIQNHYLYQFLWLSSMPRLRYYPVHTHRIVIHSRGNLGRFDQPTPRTSAKYLLPRSTESFRAPELECALPGHHVLMTHTQNPEAARLQPIRGDSGAHLSGRLRGGGSPSRTRDQVLHGASFLRPPRRTFIPASGARSAIHRTSPTHAGGPGREMREQGSTSALTC